MARPVTAKNAPPSTRSHDEEPLAATNMLLGSLVLQLLLARLATAQEVVVVTQVPYLHWLDT